MEQILKDINNPFDIQGFKNLINMLVNSSTGRDFCSKIVTYYQDRPVGEEGGYVNISDEYITSRDNGHWNQIEYFNNFFTTEHRIYINSPLESTKLLAEMFINECINQNIPFEIKYAIRMHDRSDGIVIGSNTMAYKKHIDILRKIAKEKPEIVSQCGTPHLLTSRLDNWLGLADENISNRYRSYTESRIGAILSACTKYLVKHPEFKDQIEGYEELCNTYNSLYELAEGWSNTNIKRGRITVSQRNQWIEGYCTAKLADMYNNKSTFKFINYDLSKMISHFRDEAIGELYQIFLENCEVLGINPNMPTQYDSSESDLLQVEEIEPRIKRSDLEDKNYIEIINEYFSNPDIELTVQESIILLRTIDEIMLSDVELMGDSLIDAFLLTRDTKDMKCYEYSIYSILEHCGIGDKDLEGRLAHLCERYMNDGANSKIRRTIDGKIQSQRKGMDSSCLEKIKEERASYFSKPLEPIENMKKSLSILQAMLEKHNKISPQLKNKNLETKIDFLEFMVDHYDEITEYFSAISTKLDSLTNAEIENLVKKFHIERRPTNYDFEDKMGNIRISQGINSGVNLEMIYDDGMMCYDDDDEGMIYD